MGESPYDAITGERQVQHKVEELRAPLEHVPLFQGLSATQLDELAQLAQKRSMESGQILVREGDPGEEFVLILDGVAHVEHNGQRIGQFSARDYFGEMALIDGKPRSATVIADSPGTILVIQRHTFEHILQNAPDMRQQLMVNLSGRVRKLQANLLD